MPRIDALTKIVATAAADIMIKHKLGPDDFVISILSQVPASDTQLRDQVLQLFYELASDSEAVNTGAAVARR